MSDTINSRVIFSIFFLIGLNLFLLFSEMNYYDSSQAPRLLNGESQFSDTSGTNCSQMGGECKISNCEPPNEWNFQAEDCPILYYCCAPVNPYDIGSKGGLSLLSSLTFGQFIKVNSIETTSVRFVLRLILTVICQLIPSLILLFAVLDYIRGR